MQSLTYTIEDKTLAEILGKQNFTNDESAILELVKNSYDACARTLIIEFNNDSIKFIDDGIGMNEADISQQWMHVGISNKQYEIVDKEKNKRILAGSKGIGRFALARLGEKITVYSKKNNSAGIMWKTNWEKTSLQVDFDNFETGTKIIVDDLREKWTKGKIEKMILFLSKTYNDDKMKIYVKSKDINDEVKAIYRIPILGVNCLTHINLVYDSKNTKLVVKISSDEFKNEAQQYIKEENVNINYEEKELFMQDELVNYIDSETTNEQLRDKLSKIGNFSADFFFSLKPTENDIDKFLYKHKSLSQKMVDGIVLYRNAFSISSYEGKKDWLGLAKRYRKSPAAATHETGAWRVKENQICGKILIDKNENSVLEDLSNRQGIEENIYYELFISIIFAGISVFERYRQLLIRNINTKNKVIEKLSSTPIIDKIIADSDIIRSFTKLETRELIKEIKTSQNEHKSILYEKVEVEKRYKYDIRILNVLATIGLKATSIAHEMRNDKNAIEEDTNYIIKALKKYGMWDELSSPENTSLTYRNVPFLLNRNNENSKRIIIFMKTMLSEIKKNQFIPELTNIKDLFNLIKLDWERDYAFIIINIYMETNNVLFFISIDTIRVIFDNLILNSIQQNEDLSKINISICVRREENQLEIIYKDDGHGLAKKYLNNPSKILEVHETTRENGHGLGMWIVNNTINTLNGKILDICNHFGFNFRFIIEEQKNG